jgi:hypothetical protein
VSSAEPGTRRLLIDWPGARKSGVRVTSPSWEKLDTAQV